MLHLSLRDPVVSTPSSRAAYEVILCLCRNSSLGQRGDSYVLTQNFPLSVPCGFCCTLWPFPVANTLHCSPASWFVERGGSLTLTHTHTPFPQHSPRSRSCGFNLKGTDREASSNPVSGVKEAPSTQILSQCHLVTALSSTTWPAHIGLPVKNFRIIAQPVS